MKTRDKGQANYVSDVTLNDASKDFVAAGDWEILSVYVSLAAANVTAGNRIITLSLYDDSDGTTVIDKVRAGLLQPINTTYYYHFAPEAGRITTVETDYVEAPIPPWVLRKGQMLRVADAAAIAADSDDMVVHITGWLDGSLWGS